MVIAKFTGGPGAGGRAKEHGRRLPGLAGRALVAAQAGFAAAQLFSLLLARHLWLADLAGFVRLHLLLAGVTLFVAGIACPWRAARLGGAAALAAAALPYLFLPSPAPAQEGRPLTLVSANVLAYNPHVTRFLSLPEVGAADIVVLQEVKRQWQEEVAGSGLWPHESSRDLPANSDMKVFSRFPIVSERRISPGSADTGGRHALRLEIAVGDRRVVVYAVHAQTPRSPSMWRERTAYLRDLRQAVEAEAEDAAVILAGDWNTPSWSPFMRDFLSATGYRTTESRWWPAPTRFAVRFGGITRLGTPIDRVVLSPRVGLESLSVGPEFGSNHLPVIARLALP